MPVKTEGLKGTATKLDKIKNNKPKPSYSELLKHYTKMFKKIRSRNQHWYHFDHSGDDKKAREEASGYYHKAARKDPKRPEIRRAALQAYRDVFHSDPIKPSQPINVPGARSSGKGAQGGKKGKQGGGGVTGGTGSGGGGGGKLHANTVKLDKVPPEPSLLHLDDFAHILYQPREPQSVRINNSYWDYRTFVGALNELNEKHWYEMGGMKGGFMGPGQKVESKSGIALDEHRKNPGIAEEAENIKKIGKEGEGEGRGAGFLATAGSTVVESFGMGVLGEGLTTGMEALKVPGAAGFSKAAMGVFNVGRAMSQGQGFLEAMYEAGGVGGMVEGIRELSKGADLVGQYDGPLLGYALSGDKLSTTGALAGFSGQDRYWKCVGLSGASRLAMTITGYAMLVDGLSKFLTGFGQLLETLAMLMMVVAAVFFVIGAIMAIFGVGAFFLTAAAWLVEAGSDVYDLADFVFTMTYFLQPLGVALFQVAKWIPGTDPQTEAYVGKQAGEAWEAFGLSFAGFLGGWAASKGVRTAKKYVSDEGHAHAEEGGHAEHEAEGREPPQKGKEPGENAPGPGKKGAQEPEGQKTSLGKKVLKGGGKVLKGVVMDVWGADPKKLSVKSLREHWEHHAESYHGMKEAIDEHQTAVQLKRGGYKQKTHHEDLALEHQVKADKLAARAKTITDKQQKQALEKQRQQEHAAAVKEENKAGEYAEIIKDEDKIIANAKGKMGAVGVKEASRREEEDEMGISAPLTAEIGLELSEHWLKQAAGGVPYPLVSEEILEGKKSFGEVDLEGMKQRADALLRANQQAMLGAANTYVAAENDFMQNGQALDESFVKRQVAYDTLKWLDQAYNDTVDELGALSVREKGQVTFINGARATLPQVEALNRSVEKREIRYYDIKNQHDNAAGGIKKGSNDTNSMVTKLSGYFSPKTLRALKNKNAKEGTEGAGDPGENAQAVQNVTNNRQDLTGHMNPAKGQAGMNAREREIQKTKVCLNSTRAKVKKDEEEGLKRLQETMAYKAASLKRLNEIQTRRKQQKKEVHQQLMAYVVHLQKMDEIGRQWKEGREALLKELQKEAHLIHISVLLEEGKKSNAVKEIKELDDRHAQVSRQEKQVNKQVKQHDKDRPGIQKNQPAQHGTGSKGPASKAPGGPGTDAKAAGHAGHKDTVHKGRKPHGTGAGSTGAKASGRKTSEPKGTRPPKPQPNAKGAGAKGHDGPGVGKNGPVHQKQQAPGTGHTQAAQPWTKQVKGNWQKGSLKSGQTRTKAPTQEYIDWYEHGYRKAKKAKRGDVEAYLERMDDYLVRGKGTRPKPGKSVADFMKKQGISGPPAHVLEPVSSYKVVVPGADGKETFRYKDHPIRSRSGYSITRNEHGVSSVDRNYRYGSQNVSVKDMLKQAGLDKDPAIAKAFAHVSSREGGFGAVNTYDTGYVSVGFIQFTTGRKGKTGSLVRILKNMKKDSPAEFEKYFRNLGIDVTSKGVLEVVDIDNGKVLTGEQAVTQIIKDKRLTAVFQYAGHHSKAFQAEQLKKAYKGYYLADKRFSYTYRGHKFSGLRQDVLKSEAGRVALFDRAVQHGAGNARATFAKGVRRVIDRHYARSKSVTMDDLAKCEVEIVKLLQNRVKVLKEKDLTQPSKCSRKK